MIGLAALNALPAERFAPALEGIFEHSPWVAERTASARPFASRLDLLDAMRGVVARADPARQLDLIRAHPKLGARGRSRVKLTEASQGEQRRAGLDACSDAEFAILEALNAEYEARFAIPFILAVRGHSPASIIAAMRQRLNNDAGQERAAALRQIGLIAGYRLAAAVSAPAAAEARAMLTRLAAADAGALTTPSAALLREWMLAANFDLALDAGGVLVGRRRCGPGAVCLLLGVQFDPRHDALRWQGMGAAALALAVVDPWAAAAPRSVDPVVLARSEGADGPWVLEALRQAGIDPAAVCVAPGESGATPGPGLDAAAAALENILSTFGSAHV